MTNNRLEHLNEYYITQYDCKPSNSYRSAHLDEKVRQWYFRFMNKTFDTFKENKFSAVKNAFFLPEYSI